MTNEELRELVSRFRILGFDTRTEEVKSGIGKSVRETLSAFSNSGGGTLIIGSSEAEGFTPVEGFDPRTAQNQLISRCEQMTPVVRPQIDILDLDGTLALVAKIPELPAFDKPCYVTDQGRYGGSYKRTGALIGEKFRTELPDYPLVAVKRGDRQRAHAPRLLPRGARRPGSSQPLRRSS